MSEKQDPSGVPTTGHVWDGDLADLTSQPPKWWMLGLLVSVLFVVVYWLIYPSVPLPWSGTSWKGIGVPGTGQWSAIKEMNADQSDVDAVRGKYENKLKDMTPATILGDKDLTEYVTRSSKVLFGDNCAACHGQNGAGVADKEGLIAPILNDDDWLYGGKIDTIYASISDGHQGTMPAHKDSLSAQQIEDVSKFVLALSDGKGDAPDVASGKAIFASSDCAACHGQDAKGVLAMGSANLTDKIWRFDGTLAGIEQTVTYGVNSGDSKARTPVMPNFTSAGKLTSSDMKKLAVYVYKFGGGQPEAVAQSVSEPLASPAATTK